MSEAQKPGGCFDENGNLQRYSPVDVSAYKVARINTQTGEQMDSSTPLAPIDAQHAIDIIHNTATGETKLLNTPRSPFVKVPPTQPAEEVLQAKPATPFWIIEALCLAGGGDIGHLRTVYEHRAGDELMAGRPKSTDPHPPGPTGGDAVQSNTDTLPHAEHDPDHRTDAGERERDKLERDGDSRLVDEDPHPDVDLHPKLDPKPHRDPSAYLDTAPFRDASFTDGDDTSD